MCVRVHIRKNERKRERVSKSQSINITETPRTIDICVYHVERYVADSQSTDF